MNGLRMWWIALTCLLVSAAGAEARSLPGDLLGVAIGDSYENSREKLSDVGRATKSAEPGHYGSKEIWELDDPRYSNIVVRYNGERRVEWATVFVRKDGKAVRYRDIGNLKEARAQGQYFYSWSQPASGNRPAFVLRAAGTDPERLATLSIYRSGSADAEVPREPESKSRGK